MLVGGGRLAPGVALAIALLATGLGSAGAAEQKPGQRQPLAGLGSNSREPIKIDADRLDVFDREQKAVFSGNVVAVQGETTLRCSSLTVFYEQSAVKGTNAASGKAAPEAASGAAPASAESGIRRLDCAGPVTVVSRDQIATGDSATYDKVANKVVLAGHAKLSQGQNVTTGERVVYDLNSGRATVETRPGDRVKALLVPGGEPNGKGGKPKKNDAKGAAESQ